VIIDVPLERPVTKPVLLTVATDESDELHGLMALGVPVPESCDVLPLQKVKEPVIVGSGLTGIVIVVDLTQVPTEGVNV